MSARAFSAARRVSPFTPPVEAITLLLAVLLILGIGVWLVGERHAARRAVQAGCVREVQVEIRRRPMLRNVVPAADPCLTLARMRGEL